MLALQRPGCRQRPSPGLLQAWTRRLARHQRRLSRCVTADWAAGCGARRSPRARSRLRQLRRILAPVQAEPFAASCRPTSAHEHMHGHVCAACFSFALPRPARDGARCQVARAASRPHAVHSLWPLRAFLWTPSFAFVNCPFEPRLAVTDPILRQHELAHASASERLQRLCPASEAALVLTLGRQLWRPAPAAAFARTAAHTAPSTEPGGISSCHQSAHACAAAAPCNVLAPCRPGAPPQQRLRRMHLLTSTRQCAGLPSQSERRHAQGRQLWPRRRPPPRWPGCLSPRQPDAPSVV